MKKKMNGFTLGYLKQELKKFELEETDESYVPALVLLASLVCGPNSDKIAHFIKQPRSTVRNLGKVIRKNGIWKKDKVYCNWFDKKEGGLSFILDASVAAGFLERMSNAGK